MFGAGVYLAESSTKADEYARDDMGGEYDGLYAVLVCRAILGRSYVTEKAGDFSDQVLSGEYHHVLGDREKAVGTFREFIFFHEASIYPEYAVPGVASILFFLRVHELEAPALPNEKSSILTFSRRFLSPQRRKGTTKKVSQP